MTKKDSSGIVYVVKNDTFKEKMIKIGITRNLPRRLNELSGSNVPYPFECLYACKVKDCKEVEKSIHDLCENTHVAKEFFRIEPNRVIRILKQISIKEITSDVNAAIEKKVPKGKIKAKLVTKKNSIPNGYKTYKELKKYISVKPNFKAGYFTIRLIATHKWKKVPYYQFQNEYYYSEKVFREQAANEGILVKS